MVVSRGGQRHACTTISNRERERERYYFRHAHEPSTLRYYEIWFYPGHAIAICKHGNGFPHQPALYSSRQIIFSADEVEEFSRILDTLYTDYDSLWSVWSCRLMALSSFVWKERVCLNFLDKQNDKIGKFVLLIICAIYIMERHCLWSRYIHIAFAFIDFEIFRSILWNHVNEWNNEIVSCGCLRKFIFLRTRLRG